MGFSFGCGVKGAGGAAGDVGNEGAVRWDEAMGEGGKGNARGMGVCETEVGGDKCVGAKEGLDVCDEGSGEGTMTR